MDYFNGARSPETFGEYVSALANSAMLAGKRHAFLIFGIDDVTHDIIGTNINLKKEKKGNVAFEMWLQQMLDPKINVSFETCFVDSKRVEIVCIEPAFDRPVRFNKVAYIRVGSNKTRLENYPEKERMLWALTNKHSYEKGLAATHYTAEMILDNFYCEKFAELYYGPKISKHHLIESLVTDGLIINDYQGGYDITNLFAILAAKNLGDFETVRNKAARCLIPAFDGAIFSSEWKDALWARFTPQAPRRLRQSVERYSIVKRA
ncbi:putative HTH transcriptional regulator [Rhizobium skierniewicense]|uniref:Putative HTH transcriptional regulator n=1 Tax=Rhizobium skierniewicense TaxID=984260 RepID=A0A7W6CC34_9HYPH|nr:ATP-binding protein [Rhizobium skierniewicense]MBB3948731.1 putative HTH transcriptional regulator [Rhizobium skierniewicense]